MGNNNAIGIVGVDGHTPLYQPNDRWTIWSLHDIYTGEVGKGKFIPKVNDYVVEPETGSMFVVSDLNNVTFIPELRPVTVRQTLSVDEIVSSTNDNFRVYYDRSVTPYVLAVDSFMRAYSTTATVARIYRGSFIESNKVISRRFDNSGNFIGHDIPLQLVAFNSQENYAIKSIPTCNTNAELIDGEACLVVIFDSSGKVLSRVNCVVEETTYVAQAYAEQKYITNIYLKTVFIDSANQEVIQYPVNLPLTSFNPIGVVQYNDGTQIEHPIDGTRFNLFGLDQFVSTIIGHRVPLVLSYRLSENEAALANVNTDNQFITRQYTLVVSNPNRSYNVKLFIYPVWVDNLTGYTYKAFLMNLDRNILFDVTGQVAISANSPSFQPRTYGITQRLTFTLNLANVSSIYNQFLHVQVVDIVLRGPATDMSVNNIWEVGTQVPTTVPYFGGGLFARVDLSTQRRINIANAIETTNEFLTRLYRTTIPLHNPVTELEAPDPTHIEVRYLSESIVKPISAFDEDFVFSNQVARFSNIDIVFLRETVTGTLKLSVASLTVR